MTKLKLGTGAKYNVLLSKLKPSISVQAKYQNTTKNQRLCELEVLRLDYRTVAREQKLVVILRHDVFGDEE